MKLNGGVLIIGSLIWEDDLETGDQLRKSWRNNYLGETIIETPAPIRYGRESGKKRNYTYTMIFSTSCEKQPGTALILPFNQPISSFESLELQALALAKAEGIYKEDNRRITSAWGSVGLLLNPKLKESNQTTAELITSKWNQIYSSYSQTFIAKSYKSEEEDTPAITNNGFLNISWREEMNDFDLLIATPVKPKPTRILSANEIGNKMKEKKYRKYFDENRKRKIETFQDQDIIINLKS